MRVLYVYKDYYPVLGGIENHVRLLAEGMQALGVATRVLVTNTGPRTVQKTINGVPVVKAARLLHFSSTPISLMLFPWLRRLEADADIAHLHFPYPPSELGQLFLGRSHRFVLTYHSDIVKQRVLLKLYRPFLWRVLGAANLISVSNPTYIRSSPYLRPFAGKCRVVHHGADLRHFAPTPETLALAEQIRSRYRRPIVLFVGKMRYYKGIAYLIDAMRDVDAQLVLVGGGPMEAEWRARAAACAWSSRIDFVGVVPDAELPGYYHAAHVFVLPSTHRSETWGAVQVEAMACGVPCVATELGTGTSYVNLHGQTGLIVPPKDASALAAAINQLLGNEALRRQLGENARRRAQEELSVEAMLRQTLALYQELL